MDDQIEDLCKQLDTWFDTKTKGNWIVREKLKAWFERYRRPLAKAFGSLRKKEPKVSLEELFGLIVECKLLEQYDKDLRIIDFQETATYLSKISGRLRRLSLSLELNSPIHRESGERIFWNDIAQYLDQAKQAIDEWGKKRAQLTNPNGGRRPQPKSVLTYLIWKEIKSPDEDNFPCVKKILLGAGYTATEGSVRKCIDRWSEKLTLPDKNSLKA